MATIAAPPHSPGEARGQLEAFLLGDSHSIPGPDLLRRARLAGFAYASSSPDPRRAPLRADFVHATARHLAIRAELFRLTRAWREAGVEMILFKGFYLAEFVYDAAGQRHYSDVDILMRPGDAATALAVARDLGWREQWHAQGAAGDVGAPRRGAYHGHEIMHLSRPGLDVSLDVHRRVAHNNDARLPFYRVQERLTAEAWRASRELEWDGVAIRELRPVDSILLGLVVNRCWGGDDWHLKPTDFVDFESLANRFGISRHELTARALELGCRSTLAIFLGRCDPYSRTLDLSPPSWVALQAWNLRASGERGHRYAERMAASLMLRPEDTIAVLRAVPFVVRALRAVRRGGDPLRPRLRPAFARPGSATAEWAGNEREWRRAGRAVRLGVQLLRVEQAHRREVFVLALYLALRARGLPVTVSPERSAGPTARGLELDGERLDLGDFLSRL